ncbi:MAG: phytanoyl-CoA dioxygenase family protein [Pseudomonadota bacterium]|nr:phytanoyl-CoA dioxygenase family protein [Pseudomonadota bacterium]
MTESISPDALAAPLQTRGWCIVPSFIGEGLIESVRAQLEPALQLRDAVRRRNRVEGNNDGTLHHLLADHPAYLQIIDALEPLDPVFKWYFSGNYILNSYGGVINRKNTVAYVHQVHRDIRFSSDTKRFMLNLLIMLDPFTLENGATHLLSGSQHMPQKPDSQEFVERAERGIGPCGSLLLFDSRLWHATGQNHGNDSRRALTLTFTSPFFKQQLDYPRLLGYDRQTSLSPFARQVIGYNARVPSSLDEYYVPVNERFYQRGQDD